MTGRAENHQNVNRPGSPRGLSGRFQQKNIIRCSSRLLLFFFRYFVEPHNIVEVELAQQRLHLALGSDRAYIVAHHHASLLEVLRELLDALQPRVPDLADLQAHRAQLPLLPVELLDERLDELHRVEVDEGVADVTVVLSQPSLP